MRAPDDYPVMNAIVNANHRAEGREWYSSDAWFQSRFEHLSNTDPQRDILLAEQDGRLVGWVRAGWYESHEGDRVYESEVEMDPDLAGTGLLLALYRRLEQRQREIAAGHPPGPKSLQADANDTAAERVEVLRELGYEPVRYEYVMVRPHLDDLPDAPLPEGIEIREVRPEQLRAIFDAEAEAFRDHWGTGVPTEQDFEHFATNPISADTSLWRVAWDGDQVAGMVRSFIDPASNAAYGRERGYVENISVRRPWRRRGLARALIAASIPLLRARGMTEGALGVDTENPSGALQLYESCGFVPARRHTFYRKPLEAGSGEAPEGEAR
jgi:ribosomal protein S18 acetylase RimI-like enzyme